MSELLVIRNIDDATKIKLRRAAKARTGDENMSKFVRFLIAQAINQTDSEDRIKIDFEGEKERVTVYLAGDAVKELQRIADTRLSSKTYYVAILIYDHLRNPQLLIDEIETLRRSNYQLAKIGTNLNQIARAFNTLVIEQKGKENLPKLSKNIAKISKNISDHTKIVLSVLDSKMGMYIEKRGGRRKRHKNPK